MNQIHFLEKKSGYKGWGAKIEKDSRIKNAAYIKCC